VKLLRHRELRLLEHPLRDAEGDRVHEVALPELERGWRRVGEAREVREIAPERLPALRFGLGARAPPAPEPDEEHADEQDDRVHEERYADRDEDDGRPRRREAVEVRRSDEEERASGDGEG
jgi:hypothetical protein